MTGAPPSPKVPVCRRFASRHDISSQGFKEPRHPPAPAGGSMRPFRSRARRSAVRDSQRRTHTEPFAIDLVTSAYHHEPYAGIPRCREAAAEFKETDGPEGVWLSFRSGSRGPTTVPGFVSLVNRAMKACQESGVTRLLVDTREGRSAR